MSRLIHVVVLAAAATCLLGGCQDKQAASPAVSETAPDRAAATTLPAGQPVVELWDGGIHMLGVKPYLLLAAWEDGTILVRGSGVPRWEQPVRIDRTSPDAVAGIQDKALRSRFFNPPAGGMLLYPDGPELIMTIRAGSREGKLRYHGLDPGLDRIGPQAYPSREEAAAMVQLWNRLRESIDKLPVEGLAPYAGEFPFAG